jgi:hypothetical protein
VPKSIEAESFILKDGKGEIRAVLGRWDREHAVRLRFLDENGMLLDVGMRAGEAEVRFQDGITRRIIMMLQGSGGGGGSMVIFDQDHKVLFQSPKPGVAPDPPEPK